MDDIKKERRISLTLVLEDGFDASPGSRSRYDLEHAIGSLKGIKRVEEGDFQTACRVVVDKLSSALEELRSRA